VLLRQIGSGSYGDVWLGRNVLGTLRAIKVVWRRSFDSDRPFEREFAGIQKFEPISRSHEGLVDILQIGRNNDAGYFYYVMELADDATTPVEGALRAEGAEPPTDAERVRGYISRTLRAEIERRGRLPVEECLRHFVTLASGLAALHHERLIHRDIKPSNIILVGGVPKLADIGLVTEAGESFSFVGTEGFIAPEGPGSRQADIYALGKVLYEAATGNDRLQFPSLPVVTGGSRDKADLLEINAILLRACATDLRDRYASTEEFRADLSLLLSGRSVKRLRLLERRLRWARQAGAVTGVVALLAIVGGFTAAYRVRVAKEHSGRLQAALERANRAEGAAKDRLYEALAATAVAERRSGLADARFRSLAAVAGAAEIRPGVAALRDAAISAMALPGLREIQRWPLPPGFDLQCFTPDFSRILLADTNGILHVRETSTGKELFQLGTNSIRAGFLAAAGTGHRWAVVTRSVDRTEVWDLESRSAVTNLAGTWRCVISGDWLVAGHSTEPLLCLNLATRAVWEPELPHNYGIVAGAPAGKVFIGSRSDTNLALLDPALRQFSPVLSLPQGEATYTLGARADGGFLAVNSTSGLLLGYDLNVPDRPWASLQPQTGLATYACFHPDGDWCVTSSWDAATRIVGLSEGRTVLVCRRGSMEPGFNAAGTRLGWRDRGDGSLCLHEVVGRSACRVLGEPAGPHTADNGPWHCAFLGRAGLLATASYDGVGLYETGKGRQLARLVSTNWFCVVFAGTNRLYAAGPHGVACWPMEWQGPAEVTFGQPTSVTTEFSWYILASDGGKVVSVGLKDFLVIAPDGSLQRIPHNSPTRGGILSRDGRRVAAIVPDQKLRVWNLEPPTVIMEAAALAAAGSIAFSPDGNRLVVSGPDSVGVLEVPGGQEVWRVPMMGDPGNVAWSPDGRTIVCQRDGTISVLLAAANGKRLAGIEHPDARHYEAVAFSPDSSQLACASLTHVVHLWDFAAMRRGLAALNLDWDLPPPQPRLPPESPLVVRVIPSPAPAVSLPPAADR